MMTGEWLSSFTTLIRAIDGEYLRIQSSKNPKSAAAVASSDVDGVKSVLTRAGKQPAP